MSKVITFSRYFPAYHPKKGQPTFFVEQILNSIEVEYRINDVPLIGANSPQLESDRIHTGIIADFRATLSETIKQSKHHTIRAGNRWKVGDKFSPRVWSGQPYNSKQIIIAPDIEIKKVWDFVIEGGELIFEKGKDSQYRLYVNSGVLKRIAQNDGLESKDMLDWFKYPKPFQGQIICWNDSINY